MFSITYSFHSADELNAFVVNKNKCQTDAVNKRMDERRGASTSNLHKLTKQYHELNPSITYKEALKHIGKELKTKKTDDIPLLIVESAIIEQTIIEESNVD